MKRGVLLIGLCVVGFFLIAWRLSLWPQGPAGKTPAQKNEIEGIWTQICTEMEGNVMSWLPVHGPMHPRAILDIPYLWNISKDKIEIGPDDLPNIRFTYKLNPDNIAGAMDLFILDKAWQKAGKEKTQAIYFLKDDYLIICADRDGGPRPDRFTTSAKNKAWCLTVLRRGNLKNQFPKQFP